MVFHKSISPIIPRIEVPRDKIIRNTFRDILILFWYFSECNIRDIWWDMHFFLQPHLNIFVRRIIRDVSSLKSWKYTIKVKHPVYLNIKEHCISIWKEFHFHFGAKTRVAKIDTMVDDTDAFNFAQRWEIVSGNIFQRCVTSKGRGKDGITFALSTLE